MVATGMLNLRRQSDPRNEEIKLFLKTKRREQEAQEKKREVAILNVTLEALEASLRMHSLHIDPGTSASPANQARKRNLADLKKLLQQAENKLTSSERDDWLKRLEARYDDIKASIEWSVANDRIDDALMLVGPPLGTFLFFTGRYLDGVKWIELVLKTFQEETAGKALAKVLFVGGMLYRALGDIDKAREYLTESKTILEPELSQGSAKDRQNTAQYYAFSLALLGLAERDLPKKQRNVAGVDDIGHIEESLKHFAQYRTAQWAKWGEALAYTYLGMAKLRAVRDAMKDKAPSIDIRALIEEAYSDFSKSGELFKHVFQAKYPDAWGVNQALLYKAVTLHEHALYAASPESLESKEDAHLLELGARAAFQEYLEYLRAHLKSTNRSLDYTFDLDQDNVPTAVIDARRGLARCLCGLAAIANTEGKPETALKLLGAAEAIREELGAKLVPNDILGYTDTFKTAYRKARIQLNARDAYLVGERMSVDQAIDLALWFVLPVRRITVAPSPAVDDPSESICSICGGTLMRRASLQQHRGKTEILEAILDGYECEDCGSLGISGPTYAKFLMAVSEEMQSEDTSATGMLPVELIASQNY